MQKLPKVALVSLRGVEGCGVTSWCRAFYHYFKKSGEVCDFYAPTDKVGRPDTSLDMTVKYFKEYSEVVDTINSNYDLVIIASVPSKKSKFASTYIDDFICKIKLKRVLINLDHHDMSFARNADFERAVMECDIVSPHSLLPASRGFIKWMERRKIKPQRLERLELMIEPSLYSGITNSDKYGRAKRIVSLGRAVLWKRNMLLFNIAKLLEEKRFALEILGFERSIAGYTQIKLYEDVLTPFSSDIIESMGLSYPKQFNKMSAFSKASDNDELLDFIDLMPYQPTDCIYCLGSVSHFRGLRRVSESAFATSLSSFEHMNLDYGNDLEYQGLEAMLLSVPIYHRHFLESCTLPETDIKLSSIDSFISLDDDNRSVKDGGYQVLNAEKFIDTIENCWSNSQLYERMRKQNIQIAEEYYSGNKLIPLFLSRLE
jgi:glycosyltransferase involved in cell wall biosynthesis